MANQQRVPKHSTDLIAGQDYFKESEKVFWCLFCRNKGRKCTTTCTRLNGLVKHIQGVQGFKPWACIHCDKRFTQKPHCQTHERTHTKDMHSCGLGGCQFQATDASAISRHQKNKHPGWQKLNKRPRASKSARSTSAPNNEVSGMPQQQYGQLDMQPPLHYQQDASFEHSDNAGYAPAPGTFDMSHQPGGMDDHQFMQRLRQAFNSGTPPNQPERHQDGHIINNPDNNTITFDQRQQLVQFNNQILHQQAQAVYHPEHDGYYTPAGQQSHTNFTQAPIEEEALDPWLLLADEPSPVPAVHPQRQNTPDTTPACANDGNLQTTDDSGFADDYAAPIDLEQPSSFVMLSDFDQSEDPFMGHHNSYTDFFHSSFGQPEFSTVSA